MLKLIYSLINNKKLPMLDKKQILASIALSALAITSTYAGEEYSSTTEDNTEVQYSDNMEFEAERDGHVLRLKWEKYKGDNFRYYKVMRSSTDSNPTYPRLAAREVIDNPYENSIKLIDYNDESAYYRVCVVAWEDEGVTCSNVVKLAWYIAEEKYEDEYEEEHDEDEVEDTEEKEREKEELKNKIKEKYTQNKVRIEEKKEAVKIKVEEKKETVKAKKAELSAALKERANTLLENYKTKLDTKFENNEDKVKVLTTLNTKLEALWEKNGRYKVLTDYLSDWVERMIEEYSDDAMDDIENLFNDL